MWNRTLGRWLKQVSHLRRRSGRQASGRQPSFVPGLLALEDRSLLSTLSVLNNADSGDGSLRAVIAEARDGDQIVFDHSLQGQTITLTSGELAVAKDLDIEGLGADRLAVSGNHQSRVFDISGGVTVTIAGLTITNGQVVGADGGGILNDASALTLAGDVLSHNQALGLPGGSPRGGAIENRAGATLIATDSLFTDNQAIGVADGGNAFGGAISIGRMGSLGHTATFRHCTFIGNQATGTDGGDAAGGALFTRTEVPSTVTGCTFLGNQSIGGGGGGGVTSGFSRGGAIYNIADTLIVANTTFMDNQALGGSDNTRAGNVGGGVGGAIFNADQAILFLTGSTVTGNLAFGGSHNVSTGGTAQVSTAYGGGLTNVGVATITDSTFEDNVARGGSGNQTDGTSFQLVGRAIGGAISNAASNGAGTPAILTLDNVTLRRNRAIGGDGNTGGTFLGTAWGGGLESEDLLLAGTPGGSTTTVRNSTITDNQATGGQGADGQRGGDGQGGGIANVFGGVLTISDSTLSANQALGGEGGAGGNGGSGLGGGLFNDRPSIVPTNLGAPTSLTVLDTALRRNEAVGGAAGEGGSAGLGAGGGIASGGILTVLGSNSAHNRALGGDGEGSGNGGDGLGGGFYGAGGTASLLDTTIGHNQAAGGEGADGGNGFGGGVYVGAGTVVVSASEITHNRARRGHGDRGMDGLGVGGGVYNVGTFLFDAATVIAHNHASDSNDDYFGG